MKEVAIKLLEFEDINYNNIDDNKNTPLIYACINNMKEVALKLLIFKDINYN
jgi:ankyrin repeat protein